MFNKSRLDLQFYLLKLFVIVPLESEVGLWQPISEKRLAVPLLVGLTKTERIWKAPVQTVSFLILKFYFLHF